MMLTAVACNVRRCVFVLCVLAITGLVVTAGAQNVQVQYLGIEHGLSNNAVTCIHQDSKGFMWFGTYDGLNRYDGYSFKVFRNTLDDSATLTDNRIVTVSEDAHNNIWVGTKKGLSIYCNVKAVFSSLYYQPHEARGTKKITNPINDIKRSPDNQMLIATAGMGLLRYISHTTGVATQIPVRIGSELLWNYHAQAIAFDSRQEGWVFVQGVGLCRYDTVQQVLCVFSTRVNTGNCLAVGKDGVIWLGTEIGLAEFDTRKNAYRIYDEKRSRLSARKIAGLCLDKKGCLWMATDGGGINIMNTASGSISYILPESGKKTITSAAVYAVYEDKEGRKWIGTLRGGINVIDKKKNRFTTISHDPFTSNSLVNDFILAFCEDAAHNIWIGTDGEGVSCWNRQQNKYTTYKHKAGDATSLSNNFATSIVKDYLNNVWIATYGAGVNRFDARTGTFKKYACFNSIYEDWYVWKLYEDKAHNLWAGTCVSGKLYRYNRQKDVFEVFDEKLSDVISISEDNAGNLWAGTFNKLIKIDTKSKNHHFYHINHPVRFFHQDKKGNCWIGTEGGGLLLLNQQKGDWEVLSESQGLCNNSVLNMLEDKQGHLWVSTFNGLSRFDAGTRKFSNFYGSDGLQTNQFNYNAALELQSGEFLFGGIKGFNVFYPDSINGSSSMPDLRLTGIRINNQLPGQDKSFLGDKSVYDVETIRLPYDKAGLSVDFAALEYSAPDKISYAYYLEGWDKDWNYGKLRTANYSRLHEGNYKLRIKSTNAEGIWNTEERVIHIRVLPPWYRSWWAWLLYIAMTFLLVRIYLQYQKKQTRLTYEIKLAHLKMDKEKELSEKKLSFFTNVSHEFRTPLTLIINPVKELLYGNNKETDGENLNVVYRNAKRLLSLVDQLLLFRKADSEEDSLRVTRLNFYELCYEVYLCFIQQAKNRRIEYSFACDNNQLELYADREKMEIALFNLVSNALKFTPDGGTVSFTVKEHAQQVLVHIADSGCGISPQVGDKIFDKFYQEKETGKTFKAGFGIGLYLVKNFISCHRGEIGYRNNNSDAGTTFTINLLKGKDHFKAVTIFEEVAENALFLEELTEEEPAQPVVEKEAEVEWQPAPLVTEQPVMLVIDDNEEVRDYILRLFADTYRLYQADSGEEGLLLAQKYAPDIVICDVMMGGISGIEVCSRIKEDEALSHIPVILLTAGTSTEIKLKGVECGADDYMTKPFDKEILLARVGSLLKSRSLLQKFFYNEITLQSSHDLKISEEYKAFLNRCIAIVEANIDDETFNIKTLITALGVSHSGLYKKVKAISGQSINSFIRFIRLRKAAELFINTTCNVNEAAYMVGFSDCKYFSKQFYKLFGMNPSEYIRKYRKPFQKTFRVDELSMRADKRVK